MILPTANGVAKLQSTSQSKAKLDKTQVGADGRFQKISRREHFPEWFAVTDSSAMSHHSVCLVLVVWNRFLPQAAQLLQSTPASRSPPVNSAWKKRSSPRRLTSTGSSSTRRWVSPVCLLYPTLLRFNKCSLYSHGRYSWKNRSTNKNIRCDRGCRIKVRLLSICRWSRRSHMLRRWWTERGAESFVC